MTRSQIAGSTAQPPREPRPNETGHGDTFSARSAQTDRARRGSRERILRVVYLVVHRNDFSAAHLDRTRVAAVDHGSVIGEQDGLRVIPSSTIGAEDGMDSARCIALAIS